MRRLDFTRSGRWQTIAAAAQAESDSLRFAPEVKSPLADFSRRTHAVAADVLPAAESIRRLLEYTICGHWRAAGDPPAPSDLSAEEFQQLCDAAFFGVEVNEIPAEKWREIAPLFDRSAVRAG